MPGRRQRCSNCPWPFVSDCFDPFLIFRIAMMCVAGAERCEPVIYGVFQENIKFRNKIQGKHSVEVRVGTYIQTQLC